MKKLILVLAILLGAQTANAAFLQYEFTLIDSSNPIHHSVNGFGVISLDLERNLLFLDLVATISNEPIQREFMVLDRYPEEREQFIIDTLDFLVPYEGPTLNHVLTSHGALVVLQREQGSIFGDLSIADEALLLNGKWAEGIWTSEFTGVVPEPSSLGLLAIGTALITFIRCRHS